MSEDAPDEEAADPLERARERAEELAEQAAPEQVTAEGEQERVAADSHGPAGEGEPAGLDATSDRSEHDRSGESWHGRLERITGRDESGNGEQTPDRGVDVRAWPEHDPVRDEGGRERKRGGGESLPVQQPQVSRRRSV